MGLRGEVQADAAPAADDQVPEAGKPGEGALQGNT